MNIRNCTGYPQIISINFFIKMPESLTVQYLQAF
jgi:hypothetical protein